VNSCPKITLQSNKAVEAYARLLLHPDKLEAETESLDPAYRRQRDKERRLMIRKEESQLKIGPNFKRYGAFH
jgi:hypothetical protein